MPKFRKKPVVIDAVQWTGDNMYKIIELTESSDNLGFKGDNIYISTLEGLMIASKGDYIIKGVAGEIYPCKPDIFEATYEAVVE